MIKIKEINDKILKIPVFLLLIYFLYRLINQSKMIFTFPIDNVANDHSFHMLNLHLLQNYGFHNLIPNFLPCQMFLFKAYTPGWSFFALPIQLIFNNPQLVAYTLLILVYTLGLIFINHLGNLLNLSKIKKMAFFLFFYANPLAIGYFLRLGKYSEMLAWTFFILFFALILKYKEKELDKKFFLILIPYTLILITNVPVFIFSSLILLSLFIIKPIKEKLKITLIPLISILISSFWLFPYVKNLPLSKIIIAFSQSDKILLVLTPIVFIILYLFFIKDNKKDKNFYLPSLILAIFLLTKIVNLIPILKNILPDSYNIYFIFLSITFLLKIKFNDKTRKIISFSLIITILISIIASIIITPFFIPHTQEITESLELLKNVNEKLLIINSNMPNSEIASIYNYGIINYNIQSSWYSPDEICSQPQEILKSKNYLKEGNCKLLLELFNEHQIKEIITFNQFCTTLNSCEDLTLLKEKQKTCLFKLK